MTAKHKIQKFYLKDLRPHPRIQRDHDEAWSKHIASNFDADGFGYPCIVHAPGKPYHWVFDGQHRVAAAKEALGEDKLVTCAVYDEALSDQELAHICERLNTAKSWRALDRFKNRVIAKEAVAIEINRIIQKRGLKIGNEPAPGVIRAIASCEWVYKKIDGATLERGLGLLMAAWGSQFEALDANLIKGICLFLHKHGDVIDEKHFAKRLEMHGAPVRFLGHAREYAKVSHMTVPRAVAQIFVQEYNKRLSEKNRIQE